MIIIDVNLDVVVAVITIMIIVVLISVGVIDVNIVSFTHFDVDILVSLVIGDLVGCCGVRIVAMITVATTSVLVSRCDVSMGTLSFSVIILIVYFAVIKIIMTVMMTIPCTAVNVVSIIITIGISDDFMMFIIYIGVVYGSTYVAVCCLCMMVCVRIKVSYGHVPACSCQAMMDVNEAGSCAKCLIGTNIH